MEGARLFPWTEDTITADGRQASPPNIPGEINYDRGPGHQDQYEIQLKISPQPDHNHGGENRPPYFGLIKLIRIK